MIGDSVFDADGSGAVVPNTEVTVPGKVNAEVTVIVQSGVEFAGISDAVVVSGVSLPSDSVDEVKIFSGVLGSAVGIGDSTISDPRVEDSISKSLLITVLSGTVVFSGLLGRLRL